ncbi:MAG: PQQ-binding-like beta-propeller repeat protein [Planctomycetota bacterium]
MTFCCHFVRTLLLLATTVIFSDFCVADDGDWPQWRGPNRDGHAAPQSLLQTWPEGGPKLLWEASWLGKGYSACSVVGNQLFTMGTDEAGCNAICLDAASGSELWKTTIGRADRGGDYSRGWGGGPRSTPTVDGDQVFVVTDLGVVAALDRRTGKLQWSVDMVKDYGGAVPTWGYSESVLVDGNMVMCTPGNKNFMIGLDRQTGQQKWSSKGADTGAQYVSIMKGSVGDVDYYVTAAKPGLVAFRVSNGQKLFSDDATGNRTAVIPTPLILKDAIYHTSDYGAGNTLLSLSTDGDGITATSTYALNGKTMQNHHGGVVLVDGVIYGFSKINGGVWMAQDLESGDVLWEKRSEYRDKSGSIAYADGRLYCYGDKGGKCDLVVPSRDGYQSVGTVSLPKQTEIPRERGAIWAHPVIAAGRLYIRDQDLMFAFEIGRDD